jgi:membrane-associated phospholipid phosphatase
MWRSASPSACPVDILRPVLNTTLALAVALALQTARPVAPPGTWTDDRPFTHLLQNLGHDLQHLPSAENAVMLGAGGAAALVLHPADDNVADWAARQQASSYTTFGGVLGNGWIEGGGAAATYVIGRVRQDARLTHVGSDLVRAQVLNGVLTTGIKVAADRTRPNGGKYSFPSGHTSATFTTAAVLEAHFGWRTGVPAYALAGFVGWTRVREHVHWLSDVAFGAALGTVAGRTVAGGHRGGGWTIVPVKTAGGAAIYITRR